ncbi:unnamed protein product [Vitrella brassicaformis CCMP3155]|uniref:Ion transport domain-containing protein n=2 Tax=Vitrella brassicaformis TaxID=1169539 RepID=A0A0G4H5T8_VITBC|nr:unnamed protein product [Vitrella brassicaformis CCMP3155]|eukprot:CEM39207.1 unnamed protein product [Vitrella brassicaformis CCMP3155]
MARGEAFFVAEASELPGVPERPGPPDTQPQPLPLRATLTSPAMTTTLSAAEGADTEVAGPGAKRRSASVAMAVEAMTDWMRRRFSVSPKAAALVFRERTTSMRKGGERKSQGGDRPTLMREKRDDTSLWREYLQRADCVLDPMGPLMRVWDAVIVVVLIWTAVVTPYEVAFLETKWDWLFVVNRLIDLLFLVDMIFNMFFVMYLKQDSKTGARWVKDRRMIMRHYLKGWFAIDLLSILPFDVLGLLYESKTIQRLKIVRALRLLRLLKLARVLSTSRVFKQMETSVSWPYGKIALVKFAVLIVVAGHWMACCWGLVGRMEESIAKESGPLPPGADLEAARNWLEYVQMDKGGPESDDHFGIYAVSIYWAVMTLTSIGYGDIHAQNTTEYLISTALMVIGACIWAFIIGTACGILSQLDVYATSFNQTMDELNFMLHDRSIKGDLRRRLRLFFHQSRSLQRLIFYNRLEAQMSPGLQGEMALATNERWISRVRWLRRTSVAFNIELAQSLIPAAYEQKEIIQLPCTMCFLVKGVAIRGDKLVMKGSIWGEDMILDSWKLIEHDPAVSLTYCEILYVTRSKLDELKLRHPGDAAIIREHQVRLAVRRAFLLFARMRRTQPKPTDFLSKLTHKLSEMMNAENEDMMVQTTDRMSAQWGMFSQPLILYEITQKLNTLDRRINDIATGRPPSAITPGTPAMPAIPAAAGGPSPSPQQLLQAIESLRHVLLEHCAAMGRQGEAAGRVPVGEGRQTESPMMDPERVDEATGPQPNSGRPD